MSWLWRRPATGSSCIRRCAAGRRDGVAKRKTPMPAGRGPGPPGGATEIGVETVT
jgi:hypothetical protein